MRTLAFCAILFAELIFGSLNLLGQTDRTITCSFADGKEMTVRYSVPPDKQKTELSYGKIWTPADRPMVLFTQVGLSANQVPIPVGAYTLYVISEKKEWTLIVNRGVESSAKYDAQQDVVRVPMQLGELPQRLDQADVSLGHIAPQQCNLRIDLGKVGAWAEFHEK
jgi:Protein of unknown function (DUF2911)